jgi:hypothetical protein
MKTVSREFSNSPAVSNSTIALKINVNQLALEGKMTLVEYDLDSLVKGINTKNRHIESGFGTPVSKIEISY